MVLLRALTFCIKYCLLLYFIDCAHSIFFSFFKALIIHFCVKISDQLHFSTSKLSNVFRAKRKHVDLLCKFSNLSWIYTYTSFCIIFVVINVFKFWSLLEKLKFSLIQNLLQATVVIFGYFDCTKMLIVENFICKFNAYTRWFIDIQDILNIEGTYNFIEKYWDSIKREKKH